jgi:hypothetical protein
MTEVLTWNPQVPSAKFWDSTLIRPQLLPYKSFQIHYSPTRRCKVSLLWLYIPLLGISLSQGLYPHTEQEKKTE